MYYVLRHDSLYVFEKDHYDKPIDTISLEVFSIDTEPPEKTKYNKKWVLELMRADEQPLCLACENEE